MGSKERLGILSNVGMIHRYDGRVELPKKGGTTFENDQ